jgi:hypothetical protein
MGAKVPRPHQCAYCGKPSARPTREHVFPDALDREFRKDGNPPAESYWIDRLEKKMVGGQPTVKDVCPKCNNVVLSKLDSYGLELYKRYFYRIAEAGESVKFDYDYDRLLRWILKLNFNSARANSADDLEDLQKHRWYILGEHKRPVRLALYLTLIFQHAIDDEAEARAIRLGAKISGSHHTPDMLRIGRFTIQDPGWTPLVSRTAIFQSFFFSFFFVSEKEPAADLARLKKLFSKHQPNAVLVVPERGHLRVGAGMSSSDAINTHIQKNIIHYAKIYPNLFAEE